MISSNQVKGFYSNQKSLFFFLVLIVAGFLIGSAVTFLPPFMIIIVGGLAFSLIILYKYPEIGLVFYATSLGFIEPIFNSLGVPSGLRALPIALLLVTMLVFFLLREKRGIKLGGVHYVGLCIGAILCIGFLWTPSPNYGLWKVEAYMLYSLLLLLSTSLFAGENERLVRIIYTAAFLGVIFSFVGLYTISAGDSQEWGRLTIGSFDPIWLARAMGVSFLALLMLFEITRSKVMKIFILVFLFCLVFLIFNTGSRGPTFSLFLTLLFYFAFFLKRPLIQKVVIIAIVGIIICAAFIFMPQEAQDRFNLFSFSESEQGTDYSTGRMPLFSSALLAFYSHPFFGLGTGGFSYHYCSHDTRLYPHNLFLEMGSELGILGIGLIIFFICLNFKVIFHIFKNNRRINQANFLSVWGALIFLFEFGGSMVSGDLMSNKLLFFGSGFMWAAYTTYQMKEGSEGLKCGR
ncbi:MAG: O-antigen ligase family protein [Candidatus Scalindua sp.]|nr:O-antigen ligase family protein [Candidatus Scalindua sp.]MDR4503332.1 O-antigen ligase family protein [Candidatus Scalindua sp.]